MPDAPAPPDLPTPGTAIPFAGYRGLRAWQRALDVAVEVHRLARALPKAEQDALAAELRRAAVAVPAYVAAGNAVPDRGEYGRALLAAQGALARLETLVALGERLTLVGTGAAAAVLAGTADTGRLIRALARSVAQSAAPPGVTAPARAAGRRAGMAGSATGGAGATAGGSAGGPAAVP